MKNERKRLSCISFWLNFCSFFGAWKIRALADILFQISAAGSYTDHPRTHCQATLAFVSCFSLTISGTIVLDLEQLQ